MLDPGVPGREAKMGATMGDRARKAAGGAQRPERLLAVAAAATAGVALRSAVSVRLGLPVAAAFAIAALALAIVALIVWLRRRYDRRH